MPKSNGYELLIFCGKANAPLTEEICDYLKIPQAKATISTFSDGENFVKLNENVRGRDVFIIQSLCAPTNNNLMQLLLMLDATRRASAARVTAVIPYYGYSRQDRKSQSRVPISARVVADLLESMHPNRLICMDLHADQIQGFFQIPVDHLFAAPVFVKYLKERFEGKNEDIVVVAPDSGGTERARFLAQQLAVNLAIIDKRRPEANVSEVMNVVGDVAGKTCLLCDDIIDTAGTITNAAAALKENGAKDVLACATHAVLSGPAIKRLQESQLDEIVCTNTIPLSEDKIFSKIKVLSVSHIVGEAIHRIHNEESVSSLFL